MTKEDAYVENAVESLETHIIIASREHPPAKGKILGSVDGAW